jgi:hypothetical protein
VNSALATAVIVTSLAVAVWCLVAALRDRPIGRAQLAALAVVELVALVQVAVVLVDTIGGTRPAEPVTFTGYLVLSAVLLPAAGWLATLERTRWGSVVVGVACLVLPVLVVRLQQVWHG